MKMSSAYSEFQDRGALIGQTSVNQGPWSESSLNRTCTLYKGMPLAALTEPLVAGSLAATPPLLLFSFATVQSVWSLLTLAKVLG
jgi:hypothetical protein